MNTILEMLMQQVVLPTVLLAVTTLGGWLITRLPGPLRDWLTSGTHARDITVVVGTLTRWAIAEVANPNTPHPTPAEAIEYLRRNRADLMAKMGIAPEALGKMAEAAIATAVASIPPAAPPR